MLDHIQQDWCGGQNFTDLSSLLSRCHTFQEGYIGTCLDCNLQPMDSLIEVVSLQSICSSDNDNVGSQTISCLGGCGNSLLPRVDVNKLLAT